MNDSISKINDETVEISLNEISATERAAAPAAVCLIGTATSCINYTFP